MCRLGVACIRPTFVAKEGGREKRRGGGMQGEIQGRRREERKWGRNEGPKKK